MPRNLDSTAREWRTFLTQTGRVERVSQLIASSLRLPDAAEGQQFLSVRLARFVDGFGLHRLDALIEDGETAHLRSIVGVQHSWFWREPEQFTFLISHLEGKLARGEPIRIWSAATSSGQEAYSIAIALLEAAAPRRPRADILATDLDALALRVARVGRYSEAHVAHLPPSLRQWLLHRESDANAPWQVRPEVSNLVSFRSLDLLSDDWRTASDALQTSGPETPFAAIFCRNVLMYFGAAYRFAILEGLAARLGPGGLLCLGQSENIGNASQFFEPCGRGMYLRRAAFPHAAKVSSP